MYIFVFVFLTTWPGAQIVQDATPFVIGLPFNLFVIAALILFGIAALGALYVSENRRED